MRQGLFQRRGWTSFAAATALAIAVFAAGPAFAQAPIKLNIWELQMGTPMLDLPPQYLDPHCGTNGGPQGRRLDGGQFFAVCPRDPRTGLFEIWFTEDDENEYVARAYRSQTFEPGPVAANILFGHKVIYSVLVDDAGLIQGYRVFTDPREPEQFRLTAEVLGEAIRGFYGYANFTCTDLPAAEGETEYEGRFLKRLCTATVGDRFIQVERHLLRKPGQTAVDPVTGRGTINYFDSSSRVEVLNAGLVPG